MKLLPLPRGLRLVLHQQTCAIWAPACHPDSPDVGTAGSWPGRAGLGWAVGGEEEGPEQVPPFLHARGLHLTGITPLLAQITHSNARPTRNHLAKTAFLSI